MGLHTLNVLLVDNDHVFRHVISDFLCSRHAVVYEATDHQEGLQWCQSQNFDVILIDLSMPDLHGLSMLKLLGELEIDIPRIVLSPDELTGFVAQALRLGASDYVLKSFDDFFEVEDAIQRVIQPKISIFDEYTESLPPTVRNFHERLPYFKNDCTLQEGIQEQLFLSNHLTLEQASIQYLFQYNDQACPFYLDVVNIGDSKNIFCFAYMPRTKQAVLTQFLLRNLFNRWLTTDEQHSRLFIDPLRMLRQLHQEVIESTLDCPIHIAYGYFDTEKLSLDIAYMGQGMKFYLQEDEQLLPLFMEDTNYLGNPDDDKEITVTSVLLSRQQVLSICWQKEVDHQQILQAKLEGVSKQSDGESFGLIEINPDVSFLA